MEFSLNNIDFQELNKKSIIDQIICVICTNITIEPKMISFCQHTFCEYCLNNYLLSKITDFKCPICRISFKKEHIIKNITQTNIINQLQVKCLMKSCLWVGEFNSLIYHLKNNCEYLFYCECNKIIEKNLKENHENECEFTIINCICNEKIQRKNYKNHLEKKCIENSILCDFEKYGCLWKGKRKEYSFDHEQTCKIRKLYKENIQLKNDNSEIIKIYKKSDCFIKSGFIGEDSFRKQLITKYIKSNFNLNLPFRIGSTNLSIISIISLETR